MAQPQPCSQPSLRPPPTHAHTCRPPAAEKARCAAEVEAAAAEAEAAAAEAAGIEYKRKRGRPAGSRTKKGGAGEELPPAETPQEVGCSGWVAAA